VLKSPKNMRVFEIYFNALVYVIIGALSDREVTHEK
jgi:hypothetical protein